MLLFITNSCKKDGGSDLLANKAEIKKLSDWYNGVPKDNSNFSTLSLKWVNINKNQNDDYFIYELELNNPEGIFTSFTPVDVKKSTGNQHNTIRMLIFESKKDNSLIGGYLSIAPEDDKLDPGSIHFTSLENFTGKVTYYNIRGAFIKGFYYDAGIVSGSMSANKKSLSLQQLNSLYVRSAPRNGIMSVPNATMSNQSCNYSLDPVYGQSCIEAGGYQQCTTYIKYYNIVYNCTDETFNPEDLNNPGGPLGGGDPLPEKADCAGVPGGTASADNPCHTCMGGTTGTTECPPKEIKDSLLNDCMKKVKNVIITQNGAINSLLRSFTNDNNFSPNYNWILKNSTLSDSDLANTGNWDRVNRNVTTKIDDSKFSNASDLAIAKTLLHEGIHTYLVAYFANDPTNANKEYSVLFNNYISAKRPDLNEIHHNEMARLFVSQIAISLREFGDSKNYTFSSSFEKDRFYDDLAWGGLFETKAFKALSTEVQDRIKNVISIEQKGEDNSGSPKTQKGKTGGCL